MALPKNFFSKSKILQTNFRIINSFPWFLHSQLTSIAIGKVVKQCPHIEYLSLDGCEDINDAAIKLITRNLHRLRQLDLYCCMKITKSSVQYFVQHCTNLQVRISKTNLVVIINRSCVELYLAF